MAFGAGLSSCKGWNPFLTVGTNIMNNELGLRLHGLTLTGWTMKLQSYVRIYLSFRMGSLWMMMC
jgi:hypothetical protein